MEKGTLVLTRSDIQNALSLAEYLPVIEEAHALHAQGKVYAPDLLHADVRNGEFHLKTGGICYGNEEYYGVKINGGFPRNMENYGLPYSHHGFCNYQQMADRGGDSRGSQIPCS